MSLVNKCDTRNRLSSDRNTNQHSLRKAGKANRSGDSAVEQPGTRANKPTFAEDFMLEHCHTRRQIALIGITGSSGNAVKEIQQTAQSFGFPS
jgi:hypothetical protein